MVSNHPKYGVFTHNWPLTTHKLKRHLLLNIALKVTIQALGWRDGGCYLPLQDDIATTVFWYQTEPHNPFPALPDKDHLEVN